jgi:uncharacterized protein (TIGR00156 family)
MSKPSIAVAIAAIALWSASALADYHGPGSTPVPTTVDEILKNPKDDQDVVLRGTIVRKVGDKRYVFSDGTREIQAEIKNKLFPKQHVDSKTQVEIAGEVEKDWLRSPHIDVDKLTVVEPATTGP